MLLTNNAEGGSNTTSVTAGNSGGASGDAWDAINKGASGASLTFSTTYAAHDALSYQFATGGTADFAFAQWNNTITSPSTTMYARFYCYFETSAPSTYRIFQFTNVSFQGISGIGVSGGQKIIIRNSAGSLVSTSSTTVPTDQWIRLEVMTFSNASTGQVELKIFLSPDSTTPDEVLTTAATVNTRGGNIAAAIFGMDVGVSNISLYMDDIAVSESAYIGPVDVPAVPVPVGWLTV